MDVNVVKLVYCNVEDKCCKKVKFSSNVEMSDVSIVKNELLKIAEKDEVLQNLLTNKLLVLQMFDNNANCYCDIDEDELIPDKCQIRVSLICKEIEVMTVTENVVINTGTDISFSPDEIYTVLDDSLNKLDVSEDDNVKREPLVPRENSNDVDMTQPKVNTEKRQASDSGNRKKTKKLKKNSVPYPVLLPKLTKNLLSFINEGKLLEKQAAFIYFWGSHLLEITDEPTKEDYDNYAKTIVATYNELKGGKVPHGLVKHSLQRTILNRKSYSKLHVKKETNKMTSLASVSKTTVEDSQKSFGVEDALKELKKCKFDDESNHVKRLLEVTLSYRRNFIQTKTKNVEDIFSEFPQLKRFNFLVCELFWLAKLTEENLVILVEKMLNNLAKHFNIVPACETEKLTILSQLHNTLTTKKLQKVNEPLISIEEAGISTLETMSTECSSPRLVAYTSNDVLASVYIIAGKKSWVKVPNPTVSKAIVGLISAYYSWHISYPSAYFNTLTYFDQEVMHKEHNIMTVHNFTRKVKNSITNN